MNGVRVVCVGTNIAGPVAATLFAEQGADVIQIESTLAPDMFRTMKSVGCRASQHAGLGDERSHT